MNFHKAYTVVMNCLLTMHFRHNIFKSIEDVKKLNLFKKFEFFFCFREHKKMRQKKIIRKKSQKECEFQMTTDQIFLSHCL